jgi:hypothetical protein
MIMVMIMIMKIKTKIKNKNIIKTYIGSPFEPFILMLFKATTRKLAYKLLVSNSKFVMNYVKLHFK